MKKLVDFTKKLTRGDVVKLKVYRHPHRKHGCRFEFKVGLTRSPTFEETKWLNGNTTAKYSLDGPLDRRNISFQKADDAVLFKLTFSGSLACRPHQEDCDV